MTEQILTLVEAEEAAHRYDASPDHCPFCGGSLEKHPLRDTDDTIHRRTWCEGCGAEFTEIYTMTQVVIDNTPISKEGWK